MAFCCLCYSCVIQPLWNISNQLRPSPCVCSPCWCETDKIWSSPFQQELGSITNEGCFCQSSEPWMWGIKAEEMPLVVMMDIKLQLTLPFHSSRDGKSKATKNNSPRDPLLTVCIFPSSRSQRSHQHCFVPRKKHSWHDITQPSCQECVKYEEKHDCNGWISVLLREVCLVLILSLSGGQEIFMGLKTLSGIQN